MRSDELIETRGYLDHIVTENDKLILQGWVASVNSGPVDGFKVCIAGKEYTDFEVVHGLSSADVKKVYSVLDCAEKARFRIQVPLDQEQQRLAQDALVIVTPLFKGHAGRMLLKIIAPSIPIPDEEDIKAVGGDFSVGFEFLGHFIERASLKPTEHVLDVGCGVGRMAYALTSYLEPTARYEGFDIVEKLIKWAQANISVRFPRFNFRHVDVYNRSYNPTGILQAVDFKFPYEDESFDFVFLTSVFTHMRTPEVRHYLSEIHRVLREGGRCLCTCFLLNRESDSLIAQGKSSLNIVHALDDCFTSNRKMPEAAIGFKETLLLQWMEEHNLHVQAKYYGNWCGRKHFVSYQDMIILQRE